MAKLNIIRASAGSGKTFTLTEEYLKLALRDTESFRHILAVTFTNKATAEMKNRLINELHCISTGHASKHMETLMATFNLPEAAIRDKANRTLQAVLHTYSRFFISTIDSFFQQIIRSFTREIGIQGGYSIELDAETVLDESIDRLQAETATNKILLRWLTDFAFDKIEKGNSWNFRNDIAKLGQQLFNEQFKTFNLALSEKLDDKEFMNAYQHELYGVRKKFESAIRNLALKGIDQIRSAGLDIEDFARGSIGPAGFLLKSSNGIFAEPNSYVRKATEEITGWHVKNAARKETIIKTCQAGLMTLLQEVVTYYDLGSRDYHTAERILKNFYALGILTDLYGHLRDYCHENNIFLLSEASSFLNKIIDNNEAPFVYEKAGNHFHHFMIDEFQDTSLLQWNNFKPLISNSLSQNYDNLIVGDVKQSIYRWRNSSWEILSNGVGNEFYEKSLSFQTLRCNHRSCEKIIQFNNTFFKEASLVLQDHFDKQTGIYGKDIPENLHQAIVRNFADAFQVPGQPEKTNGHVNISFLDKEEYDAALESQLILLIDNLLENGYKAGDIAILTRKNEEAKGITDFLLRLKNSTDKIHHPFDVISDETLYLSNSPAVRFLTGILRYIRTPEDVINKYYIVNEYHTCLLSDDDMKNQQEFLETTDFQDIPLSKLFPESFQTLLDKTDNFSLYELIENLISLFKLNGIKGESIYLQAFQDMVLDFTSREFSSITDFIEFWDERGYKKPVALSGHQNAIRVLTIHKAKGLEFPVVVLPYCKWDLADHVNRLIIWCKPTQAPFNQLNTVPVEFTSKLIQTHFVNAYFEELLKQYIDTINLLYVAFTRVSKALYCFSPKPVKDQLINVSDLLMKLVTKETISDETGFAIPMNKYYRASEFVFEYGELPMNKTNENLSDDTFQIQNYYPVFDARGHLKIAYQGKIFVEPETGLIKRTVSEGSIMHEIFSRIIRVNDIPAAVSKMALEGKITEAEATRMTPAIQSLFADIQVASWFSGEWKIMTEAEFILPEGSVKRPDRVLIKDDRAIVIDYKFGKGIEGIHKKQVRDYCQSLHDMGYKHTEAWLWYVMLKKIIQVEM